MNKITILHGTRRIGNLSQHVARFLHNELSGLPDCEVDYLSLMDFDFPILDERAPQPGPEGLPDFSARLAAADGILIVSPEYKNSVPGALKNALDLLPAVHFKRKAVGIATVSAGGFGGLNCLSALRLVVLSMGGVVIPERFATSRVQDQYDSEGNPVDLANLQMQSKRFVDDFLWHTAALKTARGN